MLKTAARVGAIAVCLLACRGFADVAAIKASALPQETAVLAALDDARKMEPYGHSFAGEWRYPVAKDDVASRLSKDLGFLRAASNAHPENAELLLLTGLVARYAYNLDVDHSYDTAMDVLGRAEKLAPEDIRAAWFRSTLLCQTSQPKTGAEGFLAIEGAHAWDKLPVAFWDDYMECASVTNMPAHTLRGADHLEKLHAPPSQVRSFLSGGAAKRFDVFDPNKKYDPKEVWSGGNVGDDSQFTSTTCGVRLRAHGNWEVNRLSLNNGTCLAYFSTGLYQATTQSLHPSILLLVRRAKPGETLEDFLKSFMKAGPYSPDVPSRCPADTCAAVKADQPDMYKKDGNGRGRLVAFAREEPAFPGLLFEAPTGPPEPDAKGGVQYYIADQINQRMPGKLFYLVLLDTAASIEEPAVKDFDYFLKNLIVE